MIFRRLIPLLVALLIILTLLPVTPAQAQFMNKSENKTQSYVSSPTGRIAYQYNNNIYVMNSDGTNQTLVQSGAWSPSWSPDGTKIAFSNSFLGTMWSRMSIVDTKPPYAASNPE